MKLTATKFICTLACALITTLTVTFAFAQQAADKKRGEALYTNGDAARNLPACASCHGANGQSNIATNPKLAGQHEDYLKQQLNHFKSGERVNAIMNTYAKMLTPEEMNDIAVYLSAQTPKAGAARDKNLVELGKNIYRAGIAGKKVPACASCHGPAGEGIPVQYPRLAGQHQDYTVAQLNAYRDNQRKNVMMSTIAQRLSNEEIKAVADYVAGLK